ncbi:hypothetical protein IKG29_02810 [Candidatus Saccharibacteria bacterium]|nr:hypothetical protein [Candidatus Saccharibacteria bacterium]
MKKFWKILVIMIGVGLNCLMFYGRVMAEEITGISDKIPDLYIKAINPGYVVDGKNNVGEMIEIARRNSDTPISLAGATVGYTNSSGNTSILFEFPENSWMTGESILLRLASSPESELAAVNYTKTLAFKAGINLSLNGEMVDSVCWTGKEGCFSEFKSSNPMVLVRNLETGDFEHKSEYEPKYDLGAYFVEKSEEEIIKESQCKGLIFSEILSYYETSKAEQFIEFYNSNSEQILLDGCKVRYKNKAYSLSGIVRPEEYKIYLPTEFNLTKNPTNSNLLELIDVDGAVIDKLEYPNGQRKGTAYAFIGYDESGGELWRVTYAPTPGEANNYQEFRTCEEGKAINEETGNCVKVTSVTEKICPEGQYLNILTGRCKKYVTKEEITCKEGYYLNPETGRCRKIKENTGANYDLKPESYEEKSSFVALYIVIGVLAVGILYVIYEFRHEIGKLFGKVFQRFH